MINRQTYFYFPLLTFVISWIFIFILFQLTSIQMYSVRQSTLIILSASILLVILGFISYRLFFMDDKWHIERFIPRDSHIDIDYHALSMIVAVLSLFVTIAIIVNTYLISSERGGFIEYITNPILSRKLVSDMAAGKNWRIIYSLSSYGVSINFIGNILGGLLFSSQKKRHKLLSFVPVVIGMVIGLLNFSRYTLVNSILLWLFSIFLVTYFLDEQRRKATLRQLFFITLGLIISFVFISYIIISLRSFTSSEKEIEKIYFLQMNYYIVGNIVALDRFFDQDLALHWGRSLFRSILKWLTRLGLWNEEDLMEANYSFVKINHNIVMNTYTYVRVLWEDFGLAGLLTGSFIWGFFSALTINRFLQKFTLFRLYLSAIVLIALFMSFFGFYFVSISIILYQVILISLFAKIIMQNKIIVVIP